VDQALLELDDFGTSEAVEHHRRLGEQVAYCSFAVKSNHERPPITAGH
jgi:hypothetical protein